MDEQKKAELRLQCLELALQHNVTAKDDDIIDIGRKYYEFVSGSCQVQHLKK